MALFDTTSFRILEQGLQYTSENKKVIAHNISNIDTPDYKTKFLTFSSVLREKMNSESKNKYDLHLKINDILVDENTKGQPDGNNVDYELQAAMLVNNALHQEAIISHLEGSMNAIRIAMRKQ